MVFQAPPTHRHEVEILSNQFLFSGQLETVGELLTFLNDPSRDSFTLYEVTVNSLTAAGPLQGFSRPQAVIRRPEILFLYFTSAETRGSIRTLKRQEPLVIYTPVAICRANFHLSAEASLHDFLDVVHGALIPVTEAQIFPLLTLSTPFRNKADLVLVGHSQIQFYHPA